MRARLIKFVDTAGYGNSLKLESDRMEEELEAIVTVTVGPLVVVTVTTPLTAVFQADADVGVTVAGPVKPQ
jgi:hypothetical protein